MILRDYQIKLEQDVRTQWSQGANAVCMLLGTGGGKTAIFSHILKTETAPAYAIAHRQELVSQMSLTLARNGVYHGIVAADNTIKEIIRQQQRLYGQTFFSQAAPTRVASVDTLIRRDLPKAERDAVRLGISDEGHHVLRKNKWGKAVDLFPKARWLLPTASPRRADGKGLGRHADGIADCIVKGPPPSELIARGYLTPFKIFCPASDMDFSHDKPGATGDWSPATLKKVAQKSHIVGDVVENYRQFAAGTLAVVFAPDVDTAANMTANFNVAGIAAELITAKTPDRIRFEVLRRFERRELQVIVNVDLLGEGFDCPAIETVIMARKTESLALFIQQFGRALRPLEGKLFARIIDHVGNCVRHRLAWLKADYPWSLDARDKRSQSSGVGLPFRQCVGCGLGYEGVSRTCPYCGHTDAPAARSAPEFVDGVLSELDATALADLMGKVEHADRNPMYVKDDMLRAGAPSIAAFGAAKNLRIQQEARQILRKSIAWYAGHLRHRGHSDDEIHYLFYQRFGIDVLTAQTLNTQQTGALADKVGKAVSEWKT